MPANERRRAEPESRPPLRPRNGDSGMVYNPVSSDPTIMTVQEDDNPTDFSPPRTRDPRTTSHRTASYGRDPSYGQPTRGLSTPSQYTLQSSGPTATASSREIRNASTNAHGMEELSQRPNKDRQEPGSERESYPRRVPQRSSHANPPGAQFQLPSRPNSVTYSPLYTQNDVPSQPRYPTAHSPFSGPDPRLSSDPVSNVSQVPIHHQSEHHAISSYSYPEPQNSHRGPVNRPQSYESNVTVSNRLTPTAGLDIPFTGIPSENFAGFERFVAHNPDFLTSLRPEVLLHHAKRAYVSHDLGTARAFVQQYVLHGYLVRCKASSDRLEFFKQLKSDNSGLKRRLVQQFDKVYETLESQPVPTLVNAEPAQTSFNSDLNYQTSVPKNAHPSMSTAPPSIHTSAGPGYSSAGPEYISAGLSYSSPEYDHSSAPQFHPRSAPFGAFGANDTYQQSQPGSMNRPGGGIQRPGDGPQSSVKRTMWQDQKNGDSEEEEATSDHGTVVNQNTAVRGHHDHEFFPSNVSVTSEMAAAVETLDPRYKVRHAVEYKEGHVFALLFVENASQLKAKNSTPIHGGSFEGPRRESLYASIRRMVVIRQRQGYCICVPIHTYGGRGLKKLEQRHEDAEAHAIIHMADSEPVALPGERPSKKKPIAVDMFRGQKLDKASRIHFGKPYTIDYNCRTMQIGQVTERSLPLLRRYFEQELLNA